MRILSKSDKGFTLVELLIVIAILGVLAAVVIPNMGRFLRRGETEAAGTELATIQSAVTSMMTDNKLSTLPTPVGTATNDMEAFPDATSAIGSAKTIDPNGTTYLAGDRVGFLLYKHDLVADNQYATNTVNYTSKKLTKHKYTSDAAGTVTQTIVP